jgi:energy-coupling factor transport system substrate-specific component
LFVGGWTAAFSYWVAGIPFDISHCAGNAVSVMVLYHPLRRALTTVRDRMSGF